MEALSSISNIAKKHTEKEKSKKRRCGLPRSCAPAPAPGLPDPAAGSPAARWSLGPRPAVAGRPPPPARAHGRVPALSSALPGGPCLLRQWSTRGSPESLSGAGREARVRRRPGGAGPGAGVGVARGLCPPKLAHDGTLTVGNGLLDTLGEQLGPTKHGGAVTQVPSGVLGATPSPLGLSLHCCIVGPPAGPGLTRHPRSATGPGLSDTLSDPGLASGHPRPWFQDIIRSPPRKPGAHSVCEGHGVGAGLITRRRIGNFKQNLKLKLDAAAQACHPSTLGG